MTIHIRTRACAHGPAATGVIHHVTAASGKPLVVCGWFCHDVLNTLSVLSFATNRETWFVQLFVALSSVITLTFLSQLMAWYLLFPVHGTRDSKDA